MFGYKVHVSFDSYSITEFEKKNYIQLYKQHKQKIEHCQKMVKQPKIVNLYLKFVRLEYACTSIH